MHEVEEGIVNCIPALPDPTIRAVLDSLGFNDVIGDIFWRSVESWCTYTKEIVDAVSVNAEKGDTRWLG